MREATWNDFDTVWDLVQKVVREHGGYSRSDIANAINSDEMQAHVFDDDGVKLAVITEIRQYPQSRVYTILFAGGTGIGKWKDTARAYFKSIAIANNCDEMQVIGRFGWSRIYPDAKTAWAIYRDRF